MLNPKIDFGERRCFFVLMFVAETQNGIWCVRERVEGSNTAIMWFADVITTVHVLPILIAEQ